MFSSKIVTFFFILTVNLVRIFVDIYFFIFHDFFTFQVGVSVGMPDNLTDIFGLFGSGSDGGPTDIVKTVLTLPLNVAQAFRSAFDFILPG